MKYLQLVAVSVRPALAGVPCEVSVGGDVLKAAVLLTGDPPGMPRALPETRLASIDVELKRQCAAARCANGLADVCGQLCAWQHAGHPEKSADYKHVMRAAV